MLMYYIIVYFQGQYGYTVGANFDRDTHSLFSFNNHHVSAGYAGSDQTTEHRQPEYVTLATPCAVPALPEHPLGGAPDGRHDNQLGAMAMSSFENPVDLSSRPMGKPNGDLMHHGKHRKATPYDRPHDRSHERSHDRSHERPPSYPGRGGPPINCLTPPTGHAQNGLMNNHTSASTTGNHGNMVQPDPHCK